MAPLQLHKQLLEAEIFVQVLFGPAAPVVEVAGNNHWFMPGYMAVNAVGQCLQLFFALLFQQPQVYA